MSWGGGKYRKKIEIFFLITSLLGSLQPCRYIVSNASTGFFPIPLHRPLRDLSTRRYFCAFTCSVLSAQQHKKSRERPSSICSGSRQSKSQFTPLIDSDHTKIAKEFLGDFPKRLMKMSRESVLIDQLII